MEIILASSWKVALKNEFEKEYYLKLSDFLNKEYTSKPNAIFPEAKFIFRALDSCPIENVKVVILGQDPYPTKGHAHGLCFSVNEEVKPFPKSLVNIFKEIESDLGIPFPENGSLVRWAEQGVMLLNATLTVEEGKPESHAHKGWEVFTDAVIQVLNEKTEGVVYLLWGSKAHEKAQKVDASKNLILKSVHPSPLSAYRGFFGCKHFSLTNEYLIAMNKNPINW